MDHLEDNFDVLQEELVEVQDALILLECEVQDQSNQIAELEITDENLLDRVSSLEDQINGGHLFHILDFWKTRLRFSFSLNKTLVEEIAKCILVVE